MTTLILAVACQTEKIDSAVEYGILDIAISEDPSLDVVVKSTDVSDFNVSIYKSSDPSPAYGPMKFSNFTAKVLPLGSYYVTAESCTEAEAESGAGKMRLSGKSAEIIISKEAISQTATVECTVANAKVSVSFDSSLASYFTKNDLKVEIKGGTTSKTVTANYSAAAAEFWFNPSEIQYTVSGTFVPTGTSGEEKGLKLTGYRSLTAKDNVSLVVKLNLENGEIVAPTIEVSTELSSQETVDAEFNPYE